MKKILITVLPILLGIIACTPINGILSPATPFWESMIVYGQESSNTTQVEGNIMAVFYMIDTQEVSFWVTDAQIVDRGDGKWDVTSPQRQAIGVNQEFVSYGLYKYKELPLNIPAGTYLADLDLQAITADDLPKSEHIGIITGFDPGRAKPIHVRRRYMGVNYDFWCLGTQSVKDQYQQGMIQIGDYVLVSFIEEIPNSTERHVAIVTDKVFQSW